MSGDEKSRVCDIAADRAGRDQAELMVWCDARAMLMRVTETFDGIVGTTFFQLL